jgi:hypothetical protein
MLLAALLTVLLTACGRAPPLGKGLPRNYDPGSPYFDQRVKQRFPIGSDEARLVVEIRKEGFDIKKVPAPLGRYQHSALYEAGDFACRESWTIDWATAQGKITSIEGRYRHVCL